MAYTVEQRNKAYYSGKNAGHDYCEVPAKYRDAFKVCSLTDPVLIAEWKTGFRHALSENRLNECVEWD